MGNTYIGMYIYYLSVYYHMFFPSCTSVATAYVYIVVLPFELFFVTKRIYAHETIVPYITYLIF
jgi:hypothetical protein